MAYKQLVCYSQCESLVPNGGFEENSGIPADDCSWALANGWTNAATSVEIFSTTDPYEKWTGVAKEKSTYAAQNDSYIWTLRAITLSSSEGQKEKRKSGYITLIR